MNEVNADSAVSRRKNRILLGFAIVLFSIIYVFYFPPIHGIEDEAGYINLAYVWSQGTTSPTGTAMPTLFDFETVNGKLVSWRSPGRSAVLFPFLVIFGGNSIFISSLLIHLATTLIAAWLLQRIGLSSLWALLVLFHPTLMLYSRTVMSDELGALFVLLAVVASTFKRNAGLWAGLFLGLGAFARLHVAFAVPFVAATFWFKGQKKQAILTLLGASVLGCLILAYNYFTVGTPLLYIHAEFAWQSLGDRLTAYLPALLLVFPLQLLAPAFDDSEVHWFSKAVTLPFFMLLSFYFWNDAGKNFLEDLVINQRLLIPILPVWLIGYSCMLERLFKRSGISNLSLRLKNVLTGATCLLFVLLQIMIFQRHQQHLKGFQDALNEVARTVPGDSLVLANRGLAKFLGSPPMGPPPVDLVIYHFTDTNFDEYKIKEWHARPWFITFLARSEGEPMPETFERLVRQYHMKKIETNTSNLSIYQAEPQL